METSSSLSGPRAKDWLAPCEIERLFEAKEALPLSGETLPFHFKRLEERGHLVRAFFGAKGGENFIGLGIVGAALAFEDDGIIAMHHHPVPGTGLEIDEAIPGFGEMRALQDLAILGKNQDLQRSLNQAHRLGGMRKRMAVRTNVCARLQEVHDALNLRILRALDGKDHALAVSGPGSGETFGDDLRLEGNDRAD